MAFLPEEWTGWGLQAPAAVCVNGEKEIHVVAQMQVQNAGESGWGHASCEVVRMTSVDGGKSFSFSLVSQPSGHRAHWLPSVERPSGMHDVMGSPGILYTAGGPGAGNRELLANDVYAALTRSSDGR